MLSKNINQLTIKTILQITKKRKNLKKVLKKLNRTIYNRLKSRTIESKRIANYKIDNYNKINVKIFKNTIVSIEQNFLKVEIKNYF